MLTSPACFLPALQRLFVICILLMKTCAVQAQVTAPAVPASYDQLMEQAGAALQAKTPCPAVAKFEQAFAPDSLRASVFELFAAASAAAGCPEKHALAWRWLGQLNRRRPLPMQPGDLDNIAQDPSLASLHADAAWPRWLASLRQTMQAQAVAAAAARQHWLVETQARALPPPANPAARAAAAPGFALYFSAVPADTVRMPYLVRVPTGYRPDRPAPVVVYLHGGVVSTKQFRFADTDETQEPVFAAAPTDALVIYPFGRQSFVWVTQPAAFAQIEIIVAEVQARYRTDLRRFVLGGMSNGGSAALWFASQRPGAFRGFYALSPAPTLPLGAGYGRLGQGKPCYQISAQDDDVYSYAAVKAAYEAHHGQAPLWQLQTLAHGGHGFLYAPKGVTQLRSVLAQLCTAKSKRQPPPLSEHYPPLQTGF